MISRARQAIQFCDRFFFAPVSLFPASLFRIFFGLNLLIMSCLRMKDWRFYFTDEGFVRANQALEILPEFYHPPLTWLPATPGQSLAYNIVLVGALVGLTLGLRARALAMIALLAHLGLMQRNFSIVYGADIVSSFFLFGLCFIESDRYLSLRRLFRRGPILRRPVSDLFSTVGVRLVQIQLCVIYGFTGMEKLKGPTWWDGTAVWAVIGNSQIMMIDTSWLRHFPLAIAFMTFLTVLWEVYFPVLVWVKPIRNVVLLIGVALHAGIALTVGLIFFSGAMVSAYFVFLDPSWLRNKLKRFVPLRLLPPPG